MCARGERTPRRALVAILVLALCAMTVPPSRAATVAESGALGADVTKDPWGLVLVDDKGEEVLAEDASTGTGPSGTIGFQSAGVWQRSLRVLSDRRDGGAYVAELATNDPAGRTVEVRISPSGKGVIALEATVQGAGPAVEAIGVGFDADRGAHYLGFGERSNAIDQRGNVVENYVADGPYLPDEYGLIDAIVPKWGFRPRDDATYYPIPWLLSTDGYGVLVESPETTYFHLDLNGSWSAEVVNAPPDEPPPPGAPPPGQLSMRFFAGPQPADVLKRFTRETGRQPKPAAPWLFGPWLQPVGDPSEQEALIDRVQEADAPVSVAQTYLHYLPCGAQRGLRDAERARTQAMHERGLAITTYFNPMVCTEYGPVFEDAAAGGGLIENDAGRPYLFQYSTTSSFLVAEFDFTAAAGRDAFESVVDEAIEDGHDGWMEDFGEYTPLNSRNQAGVPGTALHNPYVREYHCAANDAIADAPRPIVRFQRSGWTGTAPCAEVVWGGDPTTVWGFDGLESAIRQALTIGLSGIGIWGSDIGGYFSLFGNQLDPELLTRWVQLGAVSGVMRTEADGIAIPEYQRPQVWDPDQFANWRRYTKLRTQLYPYLVAAGSSYRHSGLPLMRQLALAYPDDKKAIDQDDEFLLGPNLLAAPVIEAGATKRSVYLPRGRWIDFWRSIAYEESDGSLEMKRAKLLRGGREVSLPAPLEELPLLARAGTILPLLPASVDTLSDYPDDSTISLSERRKRLALFAFPRGKSSTRLYEDEHIYSRERPNRWALRINGDHKRTYELRASMRTLSRPFTPCRVSLGGEPLAKARWDYDSKQQILSTSLEGRKLRVVARGEC